MLHPFQVTTEPYLFLQSGIYIINTLVLPQLVQDRVCRNLYNNTVCNTLLTDAKTPHENDIQEIASIWLSILPTSAMILNCIGLCFVGPLADTIGKKTLMVAFPVSTLIQAVIYIALLQFEYFHPTWFLFPMLTPAIIGDIYGSLCLSYAYKSDITSTSERTRAVARTEGFFYFGIAIFSILSGIILKNFGYEAVFGANVVLSVTSFIYVVAMIPGQKFQMREEQAALLDEEPVQEKRDQTCNSSKTPTRQNRIKKIIQFQQIREVLTARSEGHGILIYLVIFGGVLVPAQGTITVDVLFYSHSPLNIRKDELGYLVACINTMASFGVWFGVPLLQRFAGFEDIHFLMVGSIGVIICSVLVGMAVKSWMLYLYSIFGLVVLFPMAVTRSLVTKHVSDDLHGSALAVLEFEDSIASIFVSLVGNLIYAETVAIYPGIVIFVLGFGGVVGLLGTLLLRHWKRQHSAEL